jgi:hypothetical protein
MKAFVPFLFLVSFLASGWASPLELDPNYGKLVATCTGGAKTAGQSTVWFFKQWHLAPSVDTTSIEKSKKLPQYENQHAIYLQLSSWAERGKLSAVIAEGCGSADLKSDELLHSNLKFNGWNIDLLKKKAQGADYSSILTSVPLKLAAKYGDALHVYCGDDEGLAKKHALAFSDARGDIGFLKRLQQYKDNPEQEKIYMDGVVQTYHLSTPPSYDQAVKRLDNELKKAVSEADLYLQKRNEHLVQVIRHALDKSPKGSNIAVVFGGAHASGVKSLLEASGLQCKVVDPVGYNDDETQLFEKLKELINAPLPSSGAQ